MYIALFLSGLSGGGAQRRMITLARGFAACAHQVELLVPQDEGPFLAQVPCSVKLVALEGRLSRMPLIRSRRALRVFAAVPALAAHLRRARPDVLLSTSNPANLAALAARALSQSKVPVVSSVNIHLSEALRRLPKLWRSAARRVLQHVYRSADAVIAISQGVAADMAALGVPPERIFTIYNPIDLDRVQRQAERPPSLPWPGSDGTPVILAVGKLEAQKDFPTLVKAFARVHEVHPARLVILGDGEERDRVRRIARDLRVAEEVIMPGFVDNPFSWMARASVFVLSSAWEGLSNVLLEALACGCPVVSTDCPSGPREILQDGAYGLLVPVGDHEALAKAILSVLHASPDREVQRKRAAMFPVQAAVDGYLDVLCHIPSLGRPSVARSQSRALEDGDLVRSNDSKTPSSNDGAVADHNI